MSTAISLRLESQLVKALEVVAKSMDRPKTYLIRKAIEAYLREYADYQMALDRLHEKDDAILTSAELRKCLGF